MKTINIFIIFMLLSPMAIAHLDNGEDREVGYYIVDFGYAPKMPTAQESVTIAFNLVDMGIMKFL